MKILTQTDETPVIQKTRELCQTIVDQPAYQELRRQIQAFIENHEAVAQYQVLCDKQDLLHAKQEAGEPLKDEEIADFEREEQTFLNNPVAAAFIDAQKQMHKIEKTVMQYVRKTFETGRVPEPHELKSDGCCGGSGGGGCGCH
jgi:cell fate (sporulation/competence/biofilm development) regulator YlbF (YheA/YmcA/DUF963 family)